MSDFLQRHGGLVFLSCLTLSAVLMFNACNKEPKKVASVENTLRTGKWKLSSGTVTVRKPNGKDTTLDYLKFIPDCYLDDYLVFDSLHYGRRYTGSNICSPADPEYFVFQWSLAGNDNRMNLYNGFNDIYGIVDTVQLFYNDTVSTDPILVYDTIVGYQGSSVELDTVRKLFFSGVPAGSGPTGPAAGGFNISNADILNFSSSSFTLHFQMISYYTDSTNWHDASYLLPLDPYANPDSFAVIKPDTFNYSLTYTNF